MSEVHVGLHLPDLRSGPLRVVTPTDVERDLKLKPSVLHFPGRRVLVAKTLKGLSHCPLPVWGTGPTTPRLSRPREPTRVGRPRV